MFLTGFDATTLNTLWVDKNLKMHGLIQAFSRTNRILNSVKTFGNIVCFRNLQKRVDSAISLFGDKEAGGDYDSHHSPQSRLSVRPGTAYGKSFLAGNIYSKVSVAESPEGRGRQTNHEFRLSVFGSDQYSCN